MISIDEIKVNQVSGLFRNLPEEYVTSENPFFFESNELQMYNQGMVLYETEIEKINSETP